MQMRVFVAAVVIEVDEVLDVVMRPDVLDAFFAANDANSDDLRRAND